MKKLLIAAAVAALATSAFAATNPATTTFEVRLNVVKACTVTAGTAVDFGSADAGGAASTANPSNTINVVCSKGTAYTIGLLPLNNSTSGAGVLKGTGSNADTIAYQLRSAAGATGAAWGDTTGTMGNTGNGATQPITVYGTIEGSTNVLPDTYKDTVKVNVRY